jgi:hypothetical protein
MLSDKLRKSERMHQPVFWIALAFVSPFILLAPSKVIALDPGDAEYQACKAKEDADFIVNCYRESLSEDMGESRSELPVMPSKEKRVGNCRANLAIAKEVWRLYPDPCRTRKR